MSVSSDHRKLRITFGALGKKYETAIAETLDAAALVMKADMVEGIQKGPKTGRVYKRGDKVHQASAPSEFPASDTGTLANRSMGIRKEDNGLTIYVGANQGEGVKYAAALELGTKNMAPRPFAQPVLQKRKDGIAREVQKAVQRVNNEAKRP